MSQRGGSVDSHVRIGKKVHSPLIMPGTADFLVGLNAGESARYTHMLKKGGRDLTPFLSDAQAAVRDKRFVNTYMLGVLAACLSLPQETWMHALKRVFKHARAARPFSRDSKKCGLNENTVLEQKDRNPRARGAFGAPAKAFFKDPGGRAQNAFL